MQQSDPIYTRYEVGGRTARPSARSRAARRRGRRRLLLLAVLLMLATAGLILIAVARPAVLPASLLGRLYPLTYEHELSAAAADYDVDPYLLAAVARAESGFDAEAVSSAGAVGVMQIMPETARWLTGQPGWQGASEPDLRDPGASIALGAFYLSFLVERFDGDVPVALAAYNAGHNVVQRWVEEESARAAAAGEAPAGAGVIPFGETRDFVERVERYRDLFLKGHPDAFDR